MHVKTLHVSNLTLFDIQEYLSFKYLSFMKLNSKDKELENQSL